MNPVQYSSDSSDSENGANKILDLAHLSLDADTLDLNLFEFCDDTKKSVNAVDTLFLHHNQLKVLPVNLSRFANLKSLDISSNGLTVLPDIFQFSSLNILIAKNNNLTNDSLPKTFTASSLRELNLSGNQLTQFPEQVLEFTSLKYLYLGGNKIAHLSRNIWKLKNLHILSVGGNVLTEVPTSVGTLEYLHALVLCDNLLESLPANIANLHNLKSLLLHKNRLRTLPPEIIALRNLTELSLRDNPLVVRFVSDMTHNPASLLELSARAVKINNILVNEGDIPKSLITYLECAHHCVNPKCKGVFFDNRIEHIKFVDFCGKYRIPLLQYLCSSKCITGGQVNEQPQRSSYMMRKVLLG